MGRPRSMTAEQAALACKVLPRLLGRPVESTDIARVLQVSLPTARKCMREAATAGLLEDHVPEETAPQS